MAKKRAAVKSPLRQAKSVLVGLIETDANAAIQTDGGAALLARGINEALATVSEKYPAKAKRYETALKALGYDF